MYGSIPGFPVLFHVIICLSICQTTVLITVAYRKSWDQVMWILPYFLLQNCFGRRTVSKQLVSFYKILLELFLENTVNLYIKLERLNFFIVERLSILIVSHSLQKYDVSLHYLPLISLNNILSFFRVWLC